MIGYRDTTFCASKVAKHTCGREFTRKDAIKAEKWWGGKDYPVAYSEFCKEADNTQPDHIVDMHEMVVDNSLDVIFDKMGYTKNTDFRKDAIRLITDWHNKQTEAEKARNVERAKTLCGCLMCLYHGEEYDKLKESK